MPPQLIVAFETGTLPKAEWTHHAHLKVGLWYVLNNHFDEAVIKMRNNVLHYNECVGTANTDTSGYHETITIFWLTIIRQFVSETDNDAFENLALLLLTSNYAKTNLPLQYYSKSYLMSARARKNWVEPDLKSLSA